MDAAGDDAQVGDDALVGVIVRVEDQGAQGAGVVTGGGRHDLDDALEQGADVGAFFGRDGQHVFGGAAQEGGDLDGDFVGAGG